MKRWVMPFLFKRQDEILIELAPNMSEDERKQMRKMKAKELEDEEAVFYELARCFNVHFGPGGLEGPQYQMMFNFGSVLADLPQEVFEKILQTKHLFFTFIQNPGAEVKHFVVEDGVEPGATIQIVTFPYQSIFMPFDAARGEIAHELAEIYLQHIGETTDEDEERCDKLAKSWGFASEIKAFRDYEAESWERRPGEE